MEMEHDLILNWTNSKFFEIMIQIKSFKNPNNQSENWTEGFIKLINYKL
jgi:hypothetical protein